MKNLRKLTISARQMSHAEMKDVRGTTGARDAICRAPCSSEGVSEVSIKCNGTCSATDNFGVSCAETNKPVQWVRCPNYYQHY